MNGRRVGLVQVGRRGGGEVQVARCFQPRAREHRERRPARRHAHGRAVLVERGHHPLTPAATGAQRRAHLRPVQAAGRQVGAVAQQRAHGTPHVTHARSNTAATPWPPPTHMVSSAYRPPRRCSSCSRVVSDPGPGGPDRVAERDPGAVHVEPRVDLVQLDAPALQHGQHLHGERLVQLDQVHVVEAQAEPPEQLGHGRHRPDAHGGGLAADRGPAHQVGHRLQAQLVELVLGHDQAGGRGVVLLGRVARGDRAVLHDRAQLAQRLQAGVTPDALVPVEHHRVAAPLGYLDRHHFLGELPLGPGCGRALLAAHRVFVGGLPADPELAGQVLGRLDHAADRPEPPFWLRPFPAPVQPVVQVHVAGPAAPAHRGRVVLDVAHRLDAARHDHVGRAGLHHHRRRGHRLQASAAAPVELHSGHGDRQVRVQRGPAADARGLGVGVGLRQRHVVDPGWVHPRSFDHGPDHDRGQILGRHRAQRATEPSDRGPQRVHDRGPGHRRAPFINASSRRQGRIGP